MELEMDYVLSKIFLIISGMQLWIFPSVCGQQIHGQLFVGCGSIYNNKIYSTLNQEHPTTGVYPGELPFIEIIPFMADDPYCMTHDDHTDQVYITDPEYGGGRIVQMNSDGSGEKTVVPGLSAPRAIVKYNGSLFWTDITERRVYRSNLDGTGKTMIADDILSYGIAVEKNEGLLYLILYDTNTVIQLGQDGSNRVDITTINHPWAITIDSENRVMFVAERAQYKDGYIVRYDLRSNYRRNIYIIKKGDWIYGLAVIGDRLWFLEYYNGLKTTYTSDPGTGAWGRLLYHSALAVTTTGLSDCYDFWSMYFADEQIDFVDFPADVLIDTDLRLPFAVVSWAAPTVIDNSGEFTVTVSHQPVPGLTYDIGSTTITYHAGDQGGNTVSKTFTITVEDNEDPVITCMIPTVTVTIILGLVTAPATWEEPTATDNSGYFTMTSNYDSGSSFPFGITTVTYTAVDKAGNMATCSFIVSVKDEFQKTVDKALEDIVAFKPDLKSSTLKQIAVLKDFGKEFLSNANQVITTENEYRNNSFTESDNKKMLDRIVEMTTVIQKTVDFLPEEGAIKISADKTGSTAKRFSANESVSGSSIVIPINQMVVMPSVDISSADVANLTEGTKILLATIYETNMTGIPIDVDTNMSGNATNATGMALNATDFVGVNGSSINITFYVVTDVLDISLLINGYNHSVGVNFSIPLKEPPPEAVGMETETICAFWDANVELFSTRDVTKVKEDEYSVSCRSEHTTSFAILLQVSPTTISAVHQRITTALTTFFSSLSIIALSIMVSVLLGFEALRKMERNIIHVNLATSLLIANVVFIIGIDRTENETVCAVVAGFLHYLFLCVFGWMLVEGINLFNKIVRVYGAEQSLLRYYVAIGWGLPVPIVAVTAGIRFNTYVFPTSCWINMQNGVIWAFAGPAVITILVNSAILLMIGRILYRSVNAVAVDKMAVDGIKISLRGTMILTPLLGSTWVLGFFAFGDAAVVFQYLFVFFNSLQGVFMFVIYCLLNKEVQSVVKRAFNQHVINAVIPLNRTVVTEAVSNKQGSNLNEDGNPPGPSGDSGKQEMNLTKVEHSKKCPQVEPQKKEKGNTAAEEGNKATEEGNKAAKEGNKAAEEGNKAAEEGNKAANEGNTATEERNKAANEGNTATEEGNNGKAGETLLKTVDSLILDIDNPVGKI